MSRILEQSKLRYKKTLWLEWGILIVIFGSIALWQWKSAVDFSLGFLSAFIPFSLFVWIVFFHHYPYSEKLKRFYLAEAVKFITTIMLIAVIFKWLEISQYLIFFGGFFIALILNNLVPFLFSYYSKS